MTEITEDKTVSSRTKFDLDFTRIHEIINPADVRERDRVLARLRKRDRDQSAYTSLRVWKMSPLGVELVHPSEGEVFSKGTPIDLEIIVSGQRMYFEGLIVDLIQEN